MSTHLALTLLAAAGAAYALTVLSAVAGFGGGVLLLPVFTALFGLRVAVPVLTLAQISSNASRVALNRRDLAWPLIRRFSLGAVPAAVVGAVLLASAPLSELQRLLGVFLLGMVAYRRARPRPPQPKDGTFVGVGAASGLGSALVGSVGPLTAPFFLAYGLRRGAYIGTEAACALVMHLTKTLAYGASDLISTRVVALGLALTPAVLAGAWTGKKVTDRMSEGIFVLLVEVGLVAAGLLFLLGI